VRLLVIASLPLAAIAAWAGWRALRGRPVRRFALNAVVGVALLGYFAVTAGLGIFWVANQELPVFDPHYLFGYLTAFLVVVHVVINGPLLMRFVRRRGAALAAEGRAFRPSVAWGARAIGIVAFGATCYWIGWSRGAREVTVVAGDEVAPPGAARDPQRARGVREQFVVEDGARRPLWSWYHARSAHSARSVIARGPDLDTSRVPKPFEIYPSRAIVELPRRPEPIELAAGAAIDRANAAAAGLAHADVSLARLAALLHYTQGVTSIAGAPGGELHRRAAASGGALYPIVTHVVVGRVAGLPPGVYHYEPRAHALHRLRDGDPRGELAAAVAHPHLVARAPFALVLSAYYYKTSRKYGERGYRYSLLDAGHVAANAAVAGAALELASAAIGRFDDARVGALIGVDPNVQGPLLVLPFGAPVEERVTAEPAFEVVDLKLASTEVPASVMLIAGRTALRATGATAPPYEPAASPAAGGGAAGAGPRLVLPRTTDDGDALGRVIERRRSERRFAEAPISTAELSTVLRRAAGLGVEHQRAIRIHVVARATLGLAPGAYELIAHEHALRQIRAGALADAIHRIALSQEVARAAAAVLVISADVPAMLWPDGSRGYRYAWMDAGMAAGRIYLQGVGLRLGVSSIGAFFDDDIAALLSLDPTRQPVALLVAVGVPGSD
jgi:SagB-type dehydrogenase family enzyme